MPILPFLMLSKKIIKSPNIFKVFQSLISIFSDFFYFAKIWKPGGCTKPFFCIIFVAIEAPAKLSLNACSRKVFSAKPNIYGCGLEPTI